MTSNDPGSLKVFLCHGKEDKGEVMSLYHRLQNDDFAPWLDVESLLPGQDWEHEIRKAVREADVVVVCLSASSASRKGFAQKEIRFALDVADEQPEGEIYIIPLRLEEVDLPERLSHWHWVNYFETDGYEKLKASLDLKRSVRRTVTAPASSVAREAAGSGDGASASLAKTPPDPPKHRRSSRPVMWLVGVGILFMILILWAVRASDSQETASTSAITATYDLQVTATTIERSEPEWTSWGPEVRIPKLGKPGPDFDCTDRANRRDVCVAIPPSSEVVLDASQRPRVNVERASSWGSWCDGQREDAVARIVGDKICKPYWNWRESVSHTKRIQASVRRVTEHEESKTLTLKDMDGRPVVELIPGRFYETNLEEAFSSFRDPIFELRVKRSDDLELFASAVSLSPDLLFVSYDSATKDYRIRITPEPSPGAN
jgi:hypothetical protein